MAVLFLTAHSTLFFSNMVSGTWGGPTGSHKVNGTPLISSQHLGLLRGGQSCPTRASCWCLASGSDEFTLFSVGSVRIQLPLSLLSSASLQFSLKLRPSRTPCIPVSAQPMHHGLYLLGISSGSLTSKDENADWRHRFRSSGCITTLSSLVRPGLPCPSPSYHSPRGTQKKACHPVSTSCP